jgi:hypothetical protein
VNRWAGTRQLSASPNAISGGCEMHLKPRLYILPGSRCRSGRLPDVFIV